MTVKKPCAVCGEPFESKRPAGKYCGDRCRKRAQRDPMQGADVVDLPAASRRHQEGPLVSVTRRELEIAGRFDTSAGQRAMLAALRLDTATADTGSSVAALLKAHAEALADAVRDAEAASDTLDDIRGSAALKLIAGGR